METTTRAELELLHGRLTGQIIDAVLDVYNELGHGFAELVYQRAIVVALSKRGIAFETERSLTIRSSYAIVIGRQPICGRSRVETTTFHRFRR